MFKFRSSSLNTFDIKSRGKKKSSRSYILLRQYNNPNCQKINKNRPNEYNLTGEVEFTYSQVRHISHSLWPILEYTE